MDASAAAFTTLDAGGLQERIERAKAEERKAAQDKKDKETKAPGLLLSSLSCPNLGEPKFDTKGN